MSNQAGTVGRARGLSITSNQMRRQRSVEWQKERNYSSSEEENDRIGSRNIDVNNRKNSANAIANVDSSVLAQLIAQSQQLANAERSFRSDCETDDGISISTANENDYMNGGSQHMVTNRSPLTLRQASPFPNEMTNRRAQFNAAQERIRNGESIFTAGKPALLSNNTLIRSGRPLGNRKHITSSSSTISSVSNNNNDSINNKDKKEKSLKENFHQRFLMDSDMDSEEPPEPAPPEVPPHRDNLMANAITLKQPSNFVLKIDKNGDQIHEEYIPQNQHEYLMAGTVGYPPRSPMTNGMPNHRLTETLQNDQQQILQGITGVKNQNSHLSMPIFPLKAPQSGQGSNYSPYSPTRFNLDKRFQHKCSWKCFSIALIILSIVLTAMLIYFATVSSMKPAIDPANCILVQDVKSSQTLTRSQERHLSDIGSNNVGSSSAVGLSVNSGSTPPTEESPQTSTTDHSSITTNHQQQIQDQQLLQTQVQPTIMELKEFNVVYQTNIPPFQFWNIEFRNKHPTFIQFNFTLPWGANFAVYGRRNVLPSITQYDFVEFFKRERLDQHRFRRKRDVIDEITQHYERTHDILADGNVKKRRDNNKINAHTINYEKYLAMPYDEDPESSRKLLLKTSAFLHLTPNEEHIISRRSADSPKIDVDSMLVNVSFLEYLDNGRWFLAIYNDELVTHSVKLIVSEAEGIGNTCPNDCSGHGSCYLGKCDCIDGFQGNDCSKSVCPVLCSAHGHYGGGICHCEEGWKGSECDIPVAECEVPNCSNHGRCIEGECHCERGWKGPACNEADCLDPSCSLHGSCVSGRCFCKAGWQGEDCSIVDQHVYQCLPGCSDHGQYDLETGSCVCDRHWTGADCSQAVCSLDCGSHGICESGRCRCHEGWTGSLCEHLACDPRCAAHGQCKNGTCVCSQGWNGKYCTLPGCENGCSRHGQCTLEEGEYHCNCIEGWAGSDCSIPLETTCDDSIDNDNNGMTDCTDSECCSQKVCVDHIMCLSSNDPVDVLLRKQPPSVTASFYQRVKFLIEENSVQSYAHKDEYAESRVSVIRGQVVSSQGIGILGVRVSVDRDARFGFTLTRQGGWFDVLVNGGGAITLQFQRSPFKPLTHTVFVPWNQVLVLSPVEMQMANDNELTRPEAKLRRTMTYSFLNSLNYKLTKNNSAEASQVCSEHNYEMLQPHMTSTWMPNAIGSMPGRSVVFAETQIVQESVKIPGSDLFLTYHTSKMPGYLSIVRMHLTGDMIPKTLTHVHVGVAIEGALHVKTYEADPNLQHTFAWNKRNVYKQKVYGSAIARISIGYQYSSCNDIVWETQTAKLQGFDVDISDIGGWGLNIHHHYNFNEGILQKGDGSVLHLKEYPRTVKKIIGNGQQRQLNCLHECNGVANESKLLTPVALASGPDGSLFVGDFNLVRRITPEGRVFTIVQLSATQVSYQYYLCVSPADGHLYISDPEKHQVLKVLYLNNVTDPASNLEAVVGNGQRCIPGDEENCGDGGLAKNARLSHPKGITISADRTMYIADGTNIRAVDPKGIIFTLIGHHGHHNHWSPIPCKGALQASQVQLQWPTGLALNPLDGSLHFIDDRLVLKLTSDMKIKVVAGSPLHCHSSNETNDDSMLGTVLAMAFAPSGDLYVADSSARRINLIRTVDTAGNMKIFAGRQEGLTCKCPSSNKISTPAKPTKDNNRMNKCNCLNLYAKNESDSSLSININFLSISALAVTQDNILNVADQGSLQILALQHYLPSQDGSSEYHIPYPPTNEVYVFNRYGQHIQTKDLTTGKTKYSFLYSKNTSFGKLTAVTDTAGNKIQFLRDYSNLVNSIENTQDHKLQLKMSPNGFLSKITEKGKSEINFEYDENGLMLSRAGDSETFIYHYNDFGRINGMILPSGETLRVNSKLDAEQGLQVHIHSAIPTLFSYKTANITSLKFNSGIKTMLMEKNGQSVKAAYNINNSSLSIIQSNGITVESSAVSKHPYIEKASIPLEAEMLPMWSHQNIKMGENLVNNLYTTYNLATGDPRNPKQTLTKEMWIDNSRVLGVRYDKVDSRETFYDKDRQDILSVVYNSIGLPLSYFPANGGFPLNISYDRFNRVEGWVWGPSELKYTFERHGLLSEVSSQQDGIVSYIYNDYNLLSAIGLASQRKFLFTYDTDGGLRFVQLPTGTKHDFNLQHSIGFIRYTYTPPGSNKPYLQHYSYSGALLQTIFPGEGSRVIYRYNSNGLLSEVVHGDGKSEYIYNSETGMPTTVVHTERELEYRWDFEYNGGLLTEERIDFNAKTGLSNAKFIYDYDSNFRLISTSGRIGGQNLPPLAITYSPKTGTYDQIGQFKVAHPKPNMTNIYDGTATFTRTVDGRFLETEMTVYIHRMQVFKMEFSHDMHGRIVQTKTYTRNIGINTFTNVKNYTWDCDGQLSGVEASEPWAFRYDDNGNMLSLTYRGNNMPMEYNNMDRIIKFGEGIYKYDNSGMIVQNAREEKFHYNTQGLLVRAVKKGRYDVRYYYDHLNRLSTRKDSFGNVTQFFYNNQQRPNEVSQIYSPRDGKLMSFIYDDRGHLIFAQVYRHKYYIATDQSGTPVMIFNQYGEGIREIMRSPFGHIVYDSNPYLYLPIDFYGGILDSATSLVHMPNGKVYDPLIGLWMSPNWENTIERIMTPTKLHQYRFNGNDPINQHLKNEFPQDYLEWFKIIGYDIKSMIPQANMDLWKVPAPWGRSVDFEAQRNNKKPTSIESGFLSHLIERFASNSKNLINPQKSALRADVLTVGPFKIGSASDPPFGKGIVVSRTYDGQAIVSSVSAANAIYRDVYTSVFNRTKLLPFTLIVHNSQHEEFYFVKEDTWRSSEDRQQLKRLQGQVNTTFHETSKENSSGNNYLDVKIHGAQTIINLRYGTTLDKEYQRIMHHAKLIAVRKAWHREKELLQNGLTTTFDWNQSEVDEIIKKGYATIYDCDYIHDVSTYPELAEDPYNIRFVKKKANQI